MGKELDAIWKKVEKVNVKAALLRAPILAVPEKVIFEARKEKK